MTLGGRLSISLALLWAGAWGLILPEGTPVPIHEAATLLIMVLSFPFALVFLWPLDIGPPTTTDVLLYFGTLVPNLFLLGYGVAAILRFLTWLNGPLIQKSPAGRTPDAAGEAEGPS